MDSDHHHNHHHHRHYVHPHDDDHAALPTAGAHSQEAERQPRLGEEDARRDGRLRHLPLPLDRVS